VKKKRLQLLRPSTFTKEPYLQVVQFSHLEIPNQETSGYRARGTDKIFSNSYLSRMGYLLGMALIVAIYHQLTRHGGDCFSFSSSATV
jgi:hypothetical protein